MGRYNGDSGLFTISEFKNRGVIKMAPDALVFISGNFGTSVVAPVSGKTQKIDFQDGITTISVQNVVDPPGSSTASIEIATPIYNDRSNYWISFQGDDGRTYRVPYFVPMMEVKIYMKGRFLVGDEPKYYPVFWGFIVNVEESYSGGMYKINLQCGDMLHWWSRINVAYKPSVESDIMMGYNQNLTAYASRFERANAFQIIYTLVNEMGFENFTPPDWLGKVTPQNDIFPAAAIKTIYGGILDYWKKRFANQGNLLRMYGATGNLIRDPRAYIPVNPTNTQANNKNDRINKSRQSTQSRINEDFGVDDRFVKGFQVYHVFDKMGNLDNAEYFTKLEIATQVKTYVEYEFFQDVNGNFIFKPPFYNLNTKNLIAYRINPKDIISYSSSINSDEIVTALQIQASIHQAIRDDDWVNEVGYHIDMDMTKKYGEVFKKISLWYLSERGLARSLAAGHLSLMNVKAFVGSVSMPGRPELRLGYPVYIEHKDMFYYPRSINHSFDYGGSFTTTLSLEAQRTRIHDINARTGRWEIQKNKIYKLTDKFILHPEETLDKNKTSKQVQASQISDPEKRLEQLYRGSGLVDSNEPGRYEIQDINKVENVDRATIQRDSVPYTDEEGYRVIGSFKYGRGIVLKSGTIIDGNTISQTNNSDPTGLDVNLDRQADTITNIKTAAGSEGDIMKDYFQTEKILDVESAIPGFLDMAQQSNTPDSVVQQVTNGIVVRDVMSGNTTPILSNSDNFVDINKSVKTKTPGSGANEVFSYPDVVTGAITKYLPGSTFTKPDGGQ